MSQKYNKRTRHIEIPYHEKAAFNMKVEGINTDENPIVTPILHGLAIAHDTLGLTNLQSFFGYIHWKCSECGLGTRRCASADINCISEDIKGYAKC